MSNLNPCMTCGACCAFFRVSFTGPKPTMLAVLFPPGSLNKYPLSPMHERYQSEKPRCIALAGTPGKNACCTIYKNRSSTCREFAMSGENGVVNEACNRARAKYGLTPL
ncbi:YkgJ family cysteine cluster protein [Escherichia coli]|nr:YkgJ family cysteine cluster protein [Escherichia coli]